MMKFSKHISQAREVIQKSDRDYSLRQVARVDIEPAYLSKIERGVFQPPSEKVIVKLVGVLSEDKYALLALVGKRSSDLQQIIMQRPRLFAELLQQIREAHDHKILWVVREVKDEE